jgi:glycosyltransferase involved in cell wall biosynthesis
MGSISTVIIAYNEALNIAKCIESVKSFSTEIIVVDSDSTDATRSIAEALGAKVLNRKWDNYILQKNYGNDHTKGDYILSLDADEWLSEEVILFVKEGKYIESDIVYFNRKNNYAGKWMRWGGWYPDEKPRLWKRGTAQWGGAIPHEVLEYKNDVKVLNSKMNIMHQNYNSVNEHIHKSMKYALMASDQIKLKSLTSLFLKLLFSPSVRFFKNYFFRLGFLDGWRGLVSAVITSVEVAYKYYLALDRKINNW